jgi:hypothetical protein
MFGADTSFQRFTILLSRVAMPHGGDLITGLTNLLYEVAMPQLTHTARNPSAPKTDVFKAYPALKNSIHTISFVIVVDLGPVLKALSGSGLGRLVR